MSMLPVGIGSAEAGGYQIERSLRFNSADSAYLNRSFGSGNQKTWTLSAWVKRSALGDNQIFSNYTNGSDVAWIYFNSSNELYFQNYEGSNQLELKTTQVFRDVGAWGHLVVALDTTQATSSNRAKLYWNGVQITTLTTATYPSQNADLKINTNGETHEIGKASTTYFNGYLTEINFIDGQALTPSSFGETDTDTGVWKPKAYSGSYGTNGFYLKFADNSGTTSTTLGKDSSGNGNNWTPNNFSVTAGAGNDSLVDTPTPYGTDTGVGGEVRSNYCTLNPLDNAQGATLSNGNLQAVNAGGTDKFYRATFGMSSGKWYWEVQFANLQNRNRLGITDNTLNASGTTLTGDYALVSTGNQSYNTSTGSTPTVPTFATNDYICFAFDADAGILYFEKNATPNTSTSPKFTGLSTSKTYFVTCQEVGTASTNIFNFGQRAFQYTATSGFKALCTQNLPEPTIKDGGEYFNTVLWTGNGASSRTITGVGFQPDFVWAKSRSTAINHFLQDSVRGANKVLASSTANPEYNSTTDFSDGGLGTSASDGFTIVSGTANANNLNQNAATYVAWNWKANGAGSSNTAGTITSTVSVNTTSGFSIVTYTGTGSAGTVGHGLGAVPAMIITKNRSSGSTDWTVWHQSNSGFASSTGYIYLNKTDAAGTTQVFYNGLAMTSSSYGIDVNSGGSAYINQSGQTYVAYCFAPVAGYSAFGSYTGNGSTDGPMIFTGFKPAFVMWKGSTSVTNWYIEDDLRAPYNPGNAVLRPNTSEAELSSGTGAIIDFLSNGFKLRNNGTEHNGSGETYIYAAFAENPFKYSLAR